MQQEINKVIIFTGTPGTGKTEVAKIISEHYGYEYVHIGDEAEYILEETDVKVIDIKKMIEWIKKKQETSSKTLVIDSHLAHYYPEEKTRICFVTRCDPAELKNRLTKRGYDEMKIKINLEAEAIDLITQEAKIERHLVHEINTTHRTASSSAEEAISVLEGKEKPTSGKVDFTYYIKNFKK